jgi:hypothetical protein
MELENCDSVVRPPWNKGKIVGQKTPFKLKRSGLFACVCSSPISVGNLPFST